MDFIIRHKIIILILILAVGGFFWYSSSSATPKSLLTTETSGTGTVSANKDLVATLLTLRAVTLSGTILSDASFLRLKDFSTQVTLEDMGRTDPF
ncbi:MAG: hypothetical protein Q7K40_02960, partial [bacterium]|nr:hypothetical protein [bacterium]